MVFEHIPHPSWFTGQPYVHEYLSPISSPLRHRPSGPSPLKYPVTSTSNSYSSFNHFFILQSYHTRCFFLHSSPSFASLRKWRLLERKVEKPRIFLPRLCNSVLLPSIGRYNQRPHEPLLPLCKSLVLKALDVFIHALCNLLCIGNGFYYGPCTKDNITGCEDAGMCRLSLLVCKQKTVL